MSAKQSSPRRQEVERVVTQGPSIDVGVSEEHMQAEVKKKGEERQKQAYSEEDARKDSDEKVKREGEAKERAEKEMIAAEAAKLEAARKKQVAKPTLASECGVVSIVSRC